MTPDPGDTFWSDNVRKPNEDYTYLPSVDLFVELPPDSCPTGTLCLVKTDNIYYQATMDSITLADTWTVYSYNYPDLLVGKGSLAIVAKCGTLMNSIEKHTDINTLVTDQWIAPRVIQPAFQDVRHKRSDLTLRMLFYRGLFWSLDEHLPYPVGTSYNYRDVIHPVLEAELQLWWAGDNQEAEYYKDKGLWVNFWKDWMYYRTQVARKAEFVKLLTAIEFKKLDLSKKYRIQGVNYLIDEVKITFTDKQIKPATITAYSV